MTSYRFHHTGDGSGRTVSNYAGYKEQPNELRRQVWQCLDGCRSCFEQPSKCHLLTPRLEKPFQPKCGPWRIIRLCPSCGSGALNQSWNMADISSKWLQSGLCSAITWSMKSCPAELGAMLICILFLYTCMIQAYTPSGRLADKNKKVHIGLSKWNH